MQDETYRRWTYTTIQEKNYSGTWLLCHWFMQHLTYSVRYCVVPVNSPLLTITLLFLVIITLVYNDTECSAPFMALKLLSTVCEHRSSEVWFPCYDLLKIKENASTQDVAHLKGNCMIAWKIPGHKKHLHIHFVFIAASPWYYWLLCHKQYNLDISRKLET